MSTTPPRALASLLLALSLAHPAAAQSTALAADTDVGVYTAEGFFGPTFHQAIPAKTPMPSGGNVRVGGLETFASLSVTKTPLGVRLLETGSARRTGFSTPVLAGTAQGSAAQAAHSLLWTLKGRGAGKIVVDLRGSISEWLSVTASVAVDVGADGSIEVSQVISMSGTTLHTELPVSFFSDLPVRVTASADARAGSIIHHPDYSIDLSLDYVPGVPPMTISPYGAGCGPALTGSDEPVGLLHRLRFDFTGGLPSAYSAFVFGTEKSADPLLGTGCLLLTKPVANVFGTTTAAGAASLAMNLPGPIPTADILVQAISFDFSPRVASSNGLDVAIRD